MSVFSIACVSPVKCVVLALKLELKEAPVKEASYCVYIYRVISS